MLKLYILNVIEEVNIIFFPFNKKYLINKNIILSFSFYLFIIFLLIKIN